MGLRHGDMATQVETLLHTSNSTPLTPDLTPEPGSKQADDDTVEDKKELREAPPPKVNPWTKKPNSVTVNGQTAPGELPQHWALFNTQKRMRECLSCSCHISASMLTQLTANHTHS